MMETLSQTLLIPENRQIFLTLPNRIPTGVAEIVLVIHPQPPKSVVHKEEELLKLIGILKDSPNFNGDLVQWQRQMRDG
jgi:hypothetical protein